MDAPEEFQILFHNTFHIAKMLVNQKDTLAKGHGIYQNLAKMWRYCQKRVKFWLIEFLVHKVKDTYKSNSL